MGIIGCHAETVERQNQCMEETLSAMQADSPSERIYTFTKRGLDIVAGVSLLMLFSPCLLVAAAAIRCTSRGPVISSRFASDAMAAFSWY